MAVFSKLDSFVKQIAIYLHSQRDEEAYSLSCEMVRSFPDKMVSRFLMAKASFRIGRYDESIYHGNKAIMLSISKEDRFAAAALVAAALYMRGRYTDALATIKPYEDSGDEDIEALFVIISAAIGDGVAEARHIRALLKLNKKVAEEMIERFLLGC